MTKQTLYKISLSIFLVVGSGIVLEGRHRHLQGEPPVDKHGLGIVGVFVIGFVAIPQLGLVGTMGLLATASAAAGRWAGGIAVACLAVWVVLSVCDVRRTVDRSGCQPACP